MAIQFLAPVDLNKNEIQNGVVQNLASAPSSPVEGQIYYDTTGGDKKPYFFNGTIWVAMTGSGSVATDAIFDAKGDLAVGTAADTAQKLTVGADGTFLKAASGQTTGMQWASIAASDVSGFDTQVRTNRLDQMAAPTASVSLNSQKITSLLDPTTAQDAATKAYVDTFVNGLAPKDTVRVATTANGTLATAFENGDVIDGVTLATGDRILLKNQSAGAENGIYVVAASGAPTRATDADSSADLVGASVFVSEGTANGNTLWVNTTDAPITVDTTALVWSQFGGPGAVTAGTGITVTGQQVALTVPVSVANGGTNATDAATARTNLGVGAKPLAFNVGDNSATSIALTHNFGTRDVIATVYRNSTPWDTVICDQERTSTNVLTLKFATAPTTDQFRAVIAPAA